MPCNPEVAGLILCFSSLWVEAEIQGRYFHDWAQMFFKQLVGNLPLQVSVNKKAVDFVKSALCALSMASDLYIVHDFKMYKRNCLLCSYHPSMILCFA